MPTDNPFYMVAVETTHFEYDADDGPNSPPRKKYLSRDTAEKIAQQMADRTGKKFIILQAIDEVKPRMSSR